MHVKFIQMYERNIFIFLNNKFSDKTLQACEVMIRMHLKVKFIQILLYFYYARKNEVS